MTPRKKNVVKAQTGVPVNDAAEAAAGFDEFDDELFEDALPPEAEDGDATPAKKKTPIIQGPIGLIVGAFVALVLIVLIVLGLIRGYGGGSKPAAAPQPTVAPAEVQSVEPAAPAEEAAPAAADEPAPPPPAAVEDAMEVLEEEFSWNGDFYSMGGIFFTDGDPEVVNFEVEGAEMTYTCVVGDLAVAVSMDPGTVNGHKSVNGGMAVFARCAPGNVITMQTPHWSGKHNQIHLVRFHALPEGVTDFEILASLKEADAKGEGVYIDVNGGISLH